MTVIMKTQIDWIPLSLGGVHTTQGKTLAVMQVSDGSQSFNAVNQLRNLGRWMRLLTSPFYYQLVDVMEVPMKFTLLSRDNKNCLPDRYSERSMGTPVSNGPDQTSAANLKCRAATLRS